jgi:acyl-CoA oxidase
MDPTPLLEEPELRPFLPLLYVAWADGDLTAGERQLLHARIAAQPWLKPRVREALDAWLDPARPPPAEALAAVHATLLRALGTLSPARRASLGALAEAMAAVGGPAPSADTLAAVRELAEALAVEPEAVGLPGAAGEAGGQGEAGAVSAGAEGAGTFGRPPSFEVGALQAVLDGRLAPARDRVRAFLSAPEHRAAYGMTKEAHREKVYGWLKELAALGFGRLAYPGVTTEAEDLGPFLATFETLALGDLSLVVKFGVQFGLWGGSVYSLGTEAQRQALLPQVASLEAPGCFAMSEVGHGSNVADLETVAAYDPAAGDFVLHTPSESARKDWAGNAAVHGRWATVFAQLEVGGARHGVHALVVPIRDERGEPLPGVRIGDSGHKLGLNGVDNGRLWFERVRVPRDALLGRYARVTAEGRYESPIESPSKRFFTMLGTLVGGRVSVASGAVSAAKVGLAVAVRYATARRQFGPTSQPETLLLEYPTHQRRLLPALAATYAYHFAVDALREQFLAAPRDADTRELEAAAAGVKAGASWHATRTLQLCREACGGQGYLAVNRLPDLKSDSDIFTTFEGDNTVLLQLVARGLLTGFRQQFAKGGPLAVVRHLAGRAVTAAVEKNPLAARNADPSVMRSADFQLAALRYREAQLLSTAAARLQKRLGAKVEPTRAVNEVQEHLVALALAHVERRVLEDFAKAEAAAPEPLRPVLGRLRALHGLTLLEGHAGWYLEDGYFEGPRARAVRKEVPRLFAELLPDAVGLVDAFGIPEACLAAPIAFSDPAHPRW